MVYSIASLFLNEKFVSEASHYVPFIRCLGALLREFEGWKDCETNILDTLYASELHTAHFIIKLPHI